jgi:hypothetical protein
MDASRAVFIRYDRDGKTRRGSGLIVGNRYVLTADHCANGTNHRVTVDGVEWPATVHVRSHSSAIDLAILHVPDLPRSALLQVAFIDRTVNGRVAPCDAMGFPVWKGGTKPTMAQTPGYVLTAEGRDPHAAAGARHALTYVIVDREAGRNPVIPGALDAPGSVWAGFSGTAIIGPGDEILGVVASHALAEGQQSLTIAPLDQIFDLDAETRRTFWTALGVPRPEYVRLIDGRAHTDNAALGDQAKRLRTMSDFEEQSLVRLRTDAARRYESRTGRDLVTFSLTFEESFAALPRRFSPYEQVAQRAAEPLAPDTTIRDIYDSCRAKGGGRLLILGDPGTGKTTCLLALAADLSAPGVEPVPVYVPASRWSSGWARRNSLVSRIIFWRRQTKLSSHPMARWLASQIQTLHQIDAKVVSTWIEEGRLLLFLDGLDEIPDAADRDSFVHYLNDFLTIYPLPITLSSRRAEYEALTTKVEFDDAVVIRYLNDADVIQALQSAGPRLAGALTAVQHDPALLDLCRAPYLLQVLAYSYVDDDAEQIASEGDQTDRRAAMFDHYVLRQITADGPVEVPPEVSVRALSSLARQLQRRSYSEFHMQDMRLEWLVPNQTIVWLLHYGTVVAILLALTGRDAIMSFSFAVLLAAAWQTSGYISWRRTNLSLKPLISWVMGGLLAAAYVLLLHRTFLASVGLGPFRALPWWLNGLILGAVDGLCAGLVVSGLGPIQVRRSTSAYGVLQRMALNGVVGLVLCGVLTFAATVMTFNLAGTSEYVWTSIGDALYWGGLALAVTTALISGGVFGLYLGLGAVLDHLTVRLVMLTVPSTPLRYVAWLENMVERRLMYRAGNGYVFQHQLLRDHLATRESLTATQRRSQSEVPVSQGVDRADPPR